MELRLFRKMEQKLQIIYYCCFGLIYFRMFSRDLYRRGQENGTYLRLRYPLVSAVQGWRDRYRQRRDYRFFRCPSCRAWLRVPRGKGQINIVCRKCGTAFRRRS